MLPSSQCETKIEYSLDLSAVLPVNLMAIATSLTPEGHSKVLPHKISLQLDKSAK